MTSTAHACASYRILETPTGPFLLLERADGELRTGWLDLGTRTPGDARHAPRLLPELAGRLRRHFAGEEIDFSDVPTPGGSPFHHACWHAARAIPRGECWSYARLACMAGRPAAIRAAGQAMRRNPLPIIIPCHRVVASGGGLGGFAGASGPEQRALRTKRILLQLEGHALEGEAVHVLAARKPEPVP